ncbi:DinB family protein [Paludibaculum fermentans]|uniref:DinB family protein n=1 Tax=Paludibaculum fermentans TaxID=1473598 RepID=A0A7S7SKQ9_PALFE|nr:DinB family protein [Paludibaculum fermentans]QOY87295.1 DinB family protein [Paludibaculum fermentans]
MTAKNTEKQAIAVILTNRLAESGEKLAALAREYPEGKFETVPAAGTRTFGDVLRHVAFWNLYLAETVRGKKADGSANELPKSQYGTKTLAIRGLTESTSDAVAALRDLNGGLDAEKAAQAQGIVEHICEHYGQLAVYARLAGVVPPASRS